jgi:hypothetical protein
MKRSLIFLFILLSGLDCIAQTLNLEISNPQPRLGEVFTVSVNIDTLSAIILKPLADKFKMSSTSGSASTDYPKFTADVWATNLGENVIGPLTFEFNGKRYSTSQVKFDVVDSLPATDRGLWFRKVIANDSTFYILIDQRVPFNESNDANSVKLVGSVENIRSDGSTTTSTSTSIDSDKGKISEYSSYFGNYKFIITDKSKPVVIRKDAFSGLPPDYKFEDIVIK